MEEAPHINRQRPYAPDRGVAAQTLARFPDQVRVCVFGDLYFAHRNFETGDIQGFEQHREKNDGENTPHFAKGGRKTINVLGNRETANRMAVVERGLDALALAE